MSQSQLLFTQHKGGHILWRITDGEGKLAGRSATNEDNKGTESPSNGSEYAKYQRSINADRYKMKVKLSIVLVTNTIVGRCTHK